ncbi:MAG: O-antigen ligase family protein [Lentisphaeria bacterium]|nr:O-antigen ligase family protein [Lentisphaeria bacterium]
MKYIFFCTAILAILPGTVILLCRRPWIRWAMLGLNLPLVMFNTTSINFFSHEFYRGTSRGMEISLIYLVALIILLTFALLKRSKTFLPDWGSVLYLLYFFLSLPSLARSENLLFSFFELWKMAMIYLVYLTVYQYLEYTKGDFDILLYGIMIVVGVNFIVVVVQHLIGYYQVPGTFPHQNSMAMYMQLAGMLFFARYFNLREKRKGLLFLFFFALASASLLRTYSRGAIACYPIAGLLTLFLSVWHRFNLRKVYITLFLVFLGLVGLALFLPRIIERFEKAPESSGQTRKEFAIAAINMMKDHPLTGVGINNWGIKINPPYPYSKHREDRHYKEDYKDGIVETIYLLVGAECGIPCLTVLILWFGYYWFTAFFLLRPLRKSPLFYVPAGALGGMTGIFMQSCLEWVLKQQINFLLLVTVFAMIGYLNRHRKELLAAAKMQSRPQKERT